MKTLALLMATIFSFGTAYAAQNPQLQQLMERRARLEQQLKEELRRLGVYLEYENQVIGIQVAEQRQSPELGDQKLAQTAQRLWRESYTEEELRRLQTEHARAVEDLLSTIPISGAKWPEDRPREQYEAMARQERDRLRREWSGLRDRAPREIVPLLRRAAELHFLANNTPELPPERDFFSNASGRIAGALAQAHRNTRSLETTASSRVPERADLIRERPSAPGGRDPRPTPPPPLPDENPPWQVERFGEIATPLGEVLASTMIRLTAGRDALVEGPETFQIRIPADALAESASITVEQRSPARDVAGPEILGSLWTVHVNDRDQLRFKEPVTLHVPFDPAQMRGRGRDRSPGIGQWQNGTWWQVAGVSMARGALAAKTQDAGTYAVILLPSEYVTPKPANATAAPDLPALPPGPEIPGIDIPRSSPGKARAVELVKQGNEFWEAKELDQAENAFRAAIRLDPASAEAYNGLGVTLARRPDWASAEAAFRQACALAPDNYTYAAHVAIALRSQNKNLPEAEQFVRHAIQLKPDIADLHYQLGIIKLFMYQWTEAEAAFRQAIALKPDGGNYHACLGEALFEQGRIDEARKAAAQGKALGASETRVYAKLAKIPPDAPPSVSPVASAQPDQTRLGELLWSNQLDGALEEVRRLSQQYPNHPGVGVVRVGLEIFFGNMDAARSTAEHLLRLHPNYPNVLIARGQVAYWEDERDEVTMRKMFDRALKVDPTIAGTYYNQGIEFFNRKVYGIAYQQFATVAAMSPGQMWMSRYYLGVTAEWLGDLSDAATQYEAFLRQNPPAEWAAAARNNLARLRGR